MLRFNGLNTYVDKFEQLYFNNCNEKQKSVQLRTAINNSVINVTFPIAKRTSGHN